MGDAFKGRDQRAWPVASQVPSSRSVPVMVLVLSASGLTD